MSAANLSAVTIPLIRMVFWISPVVMVAIRSVAVSAFAAFVLDRCFSIHANPPAPANRATITTHNPVFMAFAQEVRRTVASCSEWRRYSCEIA
jgi:hypothetical protein